MVVPIPKVVSINTSGIWAGRKCVRAISLKRYDLERNAKVFEKESEAILSKDFSSKVLFLVEGVYSSVQEVLCATDIARKKGIEVEDPIVRSFEIGIAREASIDPVYGALSRLVIDYLFFNRDSSVELLRETTPDELIRFSIDTVAKEFCVGPESVRRGFSTLSFQDSNILQEEIKSLVEIRQRLIDQSNIHSRKNLTNILNKNSQNYAPIPPSKN